MAIIKLRDNRFGGNALCFKKEQSGGSFVSSSSDESEGLDGQKISGPERELLKRFGGKSLEELTDKADDAIVLLGDTHADDSDRKSQPFFTFKELNKKDNQGVDSFRLETGNLMGVLRFRDREGTSVQVEILSRFDKRENNFFLNYLLSKVYDFAIGAESVSAQRSSLLEILLDIVFVRRLGESAKAGLLRHYREFRNNDWNFKGSLDLARHIRENIPLMHGIAYRKREIDLDVPVNRMILKAALTVNRRHPGFFEGNRDAADALSQLRMGVTEEHDLRRVLSHRDCREPVSHPFFREVWEPLRQIAKMILEDERWTLFPEETTDDEVSGIVFDGSWLWEEYIATILKPAGFRHCVRGGTGDDEKGLKMFEKGSARFYPDFYKDDTNVSKRIVLDAKYKRANPNGARNDVHQVLCYLLLTGAKLGGLVFPPVDEKCEDKEALKADENGNVADNARYWWSAPKTIATPYSKNAQIVWKCFSWAPIESNDNWTAFEQYMKGQEEAVRKVGYNGQ